MIRRSWDEDIADGFFCSDVSEDQCLRSIVPSRNEGQRVLCVEPANPHDASFVGELHPSINLLVSNVRAFHRHIDTGRNFLRLVVRQCKRDTFTVDLVVQCVQAASLCAQLTVDSVALGLGGILQCVLQLADIRRVKVWAAETRPELQITK